MWYEKFTGCSLGLCGSALTFPTDELYDCLMHVLIYLGRSRNLGITYSGHTPNAHVMRAFADSNWSITRSTTGYCIMLCGAAVMCVSRRQHCITMSSCEAELIALADLAIELLHITEVCGSLGRCCHWKVPQLDERAAVGRGPCGRSTFRIRAEGLGSWRCCHPRPGLLLLGRSVMTRMSSMWLVEMSSRDDIDLQGVVLCTATTSEIGVLGPSS